MGEELGRASTRSDLVRSAIERTHRRLAEVDPLLRGRCGVEDVHAARVATRRLRSDLETLRPLLRSNSPQGLHLRTLSGELAWIGRLLGAVRDRDVLADRFTDLADRVAASATQASSATVAVFVPSPLTSFVGDTGAEGEILAILASERRERALVLVDAMTSSRYAQLIARIEDARTDGLTAVRHGRRHARAVASPLVRKACRNLDKAVEATSNQASDDELHRLRKRAKQARYAAELVVPIVGRRAHRLAERIATLQTVLGRHQDAVTAEQWLRGLQLDQLSPEGAFSASAMLAEVRRASDTSATAWKDAWQATRANRVRSWLQP